ncbi:MAG: fimbrillin family protein [Bacteroidales bacterium]|nr:fimbrillin family protein [Bacteroidales bacterium]
MKKILLFSFICFAGLAFFASCENKEEVKPIPEEAKTPIKFVFGMDTKVANGEFQTGDRVGVYMVSYSEGVAGTMVNSGNTYDNVGLQLTNNGWVPSVNMYWPDKTNKADFYAYYPHGNPDNVRAYTFNVRANQNSASYYSTSDFLWGKLEGVPPSETLVAINTKHLFSSVIVTLKAGAGFSPESFATANKSVTITGVKTAAQIDLEAGSVTATGQASAIVPYETGDGYKAIVVPQAITSSQPFITISMNGESYNFKTDITFKTGMMYTFTITVNRTGAGINIGISDWDSDGEVHTGTAE